MSKADEMSTPRTDAAEVDLNEVTCTAFVGEKQVVVTKYVPAYKMREIERELSRVTAELGEQLRDGASICQVLGHDYMDPPDGGSVSVPEQVARMKAELSACRQRAESAEVDAAKWREHMDVRAAARRPGSLYVRMTMQPEASGTDKAWHTECVLDTRTFGQSTLGIRAVGLCVEGKAKELFAAIDAARGKA